MFSNEYLFSHVPNIEHCILEKSTPQGFPEKFCVMLNTFRIIIFLYNICLTYFIHTEFLSVFPMVW